MGPEVEKRRRGSYKPKPSIRQLEEAARVYEEEDVSFYVAATKVGIAPHRLHAYLDEQGRLRPREVAHSATFRRHRESREKSE